MTNRSAMVVISSDAQQPGTGLDNARPSVAAEAIPRRKHRVLIAVDI
jgi:hypothetical protein